MPSCDNMYWIMFIVAIIAYCFHRRKMSLLKDQITMDQLIDSVMLVWRNGIPHQKTYPNYIPQYLAGDFKKRMRSRYPGIGVLVLRNCITVFNGYNPTIVLEIIE